jgi:hypothetical protein
VAVDVGREDGADYAGANERQHAPGCDQASPPDLLPPLIPAHLEALVGVNGLENRGQGSET